MDRTIVAATQAVQQFLISLRRYDSDVIEECNELLLSIWHVENAIIRTQIIQTAAINLGWLSDEN